MNNLLKKKQCSGETVVFEVRFLVSPTNCLTMGKLFKLVLVCLLFKETLYLFVGELQTVLST